MAENPKVPPKLALLVSIIAVSTASILIRMSQASPLVIAAYRLIFATSILFPFFLINRGYFPLRLLSWRRFLILVVTGVILAIHFASWISSLRLTSVASSVIFVHVDPIFVVIISHYCYGEHISTRRMLGILTAFSGVTIIGLGDMRMSNLNFYGDLLALLGAIMFGLYILSGRRLRQTLPLISYVTPVYASSASVLTLICLIARAPLAPYPPREYLLFLCIALVPMIFGHTVYNWALRYIEAPLVSISLLGEPVGATILAHYFLNESPTPLTIIGGCITLLGIYLSIGTFKK